MSQAIHLEIEVPDDLARLRLPEGVQQRLMELLDKQDTGTKLTEAELREANGLVDLAELLSLLRLRLERVEFARGLVHGDTGRTAAAGNRTGRELLRALLSSSEGPRSRFPHRPRRAGYCRRRNEPRESGTGLRLLLPAKRSSRTCERPAYSRRGRAVSSAPGPVADAFPLGRGASVRCHTDRTPNDHGTQHEPSAGVGNPRGGSLSREASAPSASGGELKKGKFTHV